MTTLKYVDKLPRNITPASIQIGDTIRVTVTVGDAQRSITGTVAKREYQGAERVYTTAEGVELCVWHPEHKAPSVTLLAPAVPHNPEPLFTGLEI